MSFLKVQDSSFFMKMFNSAPWKLLKGILPRYLKGLQTYSANLFIVLKSHKSKMGVIYIQI